MFVKVLCTAGCSQFQQSNCWGVQQAMVVGCPRLALNRHRTFWTMGHRLATRIRDPCGYHCIWLWFPTTPPQLGPNGLVEVWHSHWSHWFEEQNGLNNWLVAVFAVPKNNSQSTIPKNEKIKHVQNPQLDMDRKRGRMNRNVSSLSCATTAVHFFSKWKSTPSQLRQRWLVVEPLSGGWL